MNRGTMGVNSLPKLLPDCDLNPGTSAPESSSLTTQVPSHHGMCFPYCSFPFWPPTIIEMLFSVLTQVGRRNHLMSPCISPVACRSVHSFLHNSRFAKRHTNTQITPRMKTRNLPALGFLLASSIIIMLSANHNQKPTKVT